MTSQYLALNDVDPVHSLFVAEHMLFSRMHKNPVVFVQGLAPQAQMLLSLVINSRFEAEPSMFKHSLTHVGSAAPDGSGLIPV